MCQTTVLLSDHAAGCFCLHCQCPIEPGLASGLCVECYLDAVYSDGEFDLPVEDALPVCCLCGRLFEPSYPGEAVCNGGACDGRDWPPPDDAPLPCVDDSHHVFAWPASGPGRCEKCGLRYDVWFQDQQCRFGDLPF